MKCSSCGKENPEGMKFCIHCGQDLASAKEKKDLELIGHISCPNCGFENSPEVRFCPQCGTSLLSASATVQPPRTYIGLIIGGITVPTAIFLLLTAVSKPWIPAVQWRKTIGDMAIVMLPIGPFGSLQGVPVEAEGVCPICPFCREHVNWRSTACPRCGKNFRWVAARCPACDGTGMCSSCDGSGEFTIEREGRKVVIEIEGRKIGCPICEESGKCQSCKGDGVIGNETKEGD